MARKKKQKQARARGTSSAANKRLSGQKGRLRTSFRILRDVARTADDTLRGAAIVDRPVERIQVGVFVRGINAVKSTRLLSEESQWEFAAAAVRQVFELVINMEHLLKQPDVEAAAFRYAKFGCFKSCAVRTRTLCTRRRRVGRSILTTLRHSNTCSDNAFGEFRAVTKKGKVVWANSWCGMTVRGLADASTHSLRSHQYVILFSSWSEQTHGSPSTILADIVGDRGSSFEELLASDEPRVGATAAMAVVLFTELWRMLPAIPSPPEEKSEGWQRDLRADAESRWKPSAAALTLHPSSSAND